MHMHLLSTRDPYGMQTILCLVTILPILYRYCIGKIVNKQRLYATEYLVQGIPVFGVRVSVMFHLIFVNII